MNTKMEIELSEKNRESLMSAMKKAYEDALRNPPLCFSVCMAADGNVYTFEELAGGNSEPEAVWAGRDACIVTYDERFFNTLSYVTGEWTDTEWDAALIKHGMTRASIQALRECSNDNGLSIANYLEQDMWDKLFDDAVEWLVGEEDFGLQLDERVERLREIEKEDAERAAEEKAWLEEQRACLQHSEDWD